MSGLGRRPRNGLLALSVVAALSGSATAALAQASGCGDLQGQLLQRKAIGDRISAGGKKQIDAKVACTGFTQLVQNGTTLIKWVEANKEWCQVPDSFIESIKADHGKAQAIRTKACTFAARQIEVEKQNRNGGGGLLGGGGLSGSTAMPQGAL